MHLARVCGYDRGSAQSSPVAQSTSPDHLVLAPVLRGQHTTHPLQIGLSNKASELYEELRAVVQASHTLRMCRADVLQCETL